MVENNGAKNNAGGALITGGRQGLLRFNALCHPVRFAKVAARTILSGKFKTPDKIEAIEPDGYGEVVALTTTTGNYVVYGYASKNCGAHERTFGGMDDTGSSNLGELKRRLDVVCHSVPFGEVNALLPPKRRIVTYLPIRDQVRAVGAAAEMRAVLKTGNPTAIREMLLMEAAGRKRRWIIERLDMDVESRLKVCVFTGRRRDCEELMEAAEKRYCGKAKIFGGHGGHSAADRNRVKDEYMAAPGPAILIGTGDAWGEGLDLQDTDHGIMAMLPYEPAQVIQREGRWVRLGQKRPVIIEYPVCEGTYDERVSEILLTKLPAIEKVINQDEVKSFGRELIGADDERVLETLAAKIVAGTKRKEEVNIEPEEAA